MRDRHVRLLGGFAALILLAAGAAACGGSTLPTIPTPVSSTWQYFSPSVTAGGTAVSTFTVSSTSTIGVTLASVAAADGSAIQPTLRVALGTPAAGGCTATSTKDTTPGWSAQIQTQLNSGSYCVSVTDTGGALPSTSVVTVRVTTSVSAPTTSVNTGTDLVTGTMLKGGSLMHEFAASFGGTATITLTSAGDGSATLNLGAGVWDGSTCRLLTLVNTTASSTPQITQAIDGGRYCLTLADAGQITSPTLFTVTITRP